MIKLQSFAYLRPNKMCLSIFLVCTFFIIFITRVMWFKYERYQLIHSDFNAENDTYDSLDFESVTKKQAQIRSLKKLRKKIFHIHEEQLVYNQHLYGPVNSHTIIIVVQVHKKVDHLRMLLTSLEKVTGIQKTLLIFAHDYLNEDSEFLIQNIEFARFMRVYYLFSNQMNPGLFPGEDFTFCTPGYKCETNDYTRNSPAAQTKHFWWWTVNQVFDHLKVTEGYDDFILFLEEDQYVIEDLIYIFNTFKDILTKNCPICEMISLGAHHPNITQFHINEALVLVEPFGSTDYSMGYAFNRTFWNAIKSLRHHFCYVNDHTWANSLRYLGTQRPSTPILMLAIEAPRVLYTGACYPEWDDMNSAINDCKLDEKLREVKEVTLLISRGLFPRTLGVVSKSGERIPRLKFSRGWDDVRDKDLCMFLASEQMSTFKFGNK